MVEKQSGNEKCYSLGFGGGAGGGFMGVPDRVPPFGLSGIQRLLLHLYSTL